MLCSVLICRFLSVQPQPPQITRIEIPNENNNIDELFAFDTIENLLPPVVPTTNELFRTVEQFRNSRKDEIDNTIRKERVDKVNISTNSRIDEVNVSTYDMMINPVNDGNKSRTTMHDFSKRLDDDGYDATNPTETFNNDNEFVSITGPRINWDDMFDTELIPATTDAKLMKQDNASETTGESTFNVVFPEGTDQENKTNARKLTKTKGNKQNYVKKAKRKTQQKVTDAMPKKVKKISEQLQNNFRKQIYTTTVKSWLDDVNPNNPVEEESTGKKDIAEGTATKTDPTDFDKSNDNPNRKVVQAQLANKDGKMKFGKPKVKIETETAAVIIDKSDKNKKTKLKFVAPIKSLVPVKEVEYEVVPVDCTNTRGLTESLRFEKKDLIIVLLYR